MGIPGKMCHVEIVKMNIFCSYFKAAKPADQLIFILKQEKISLFR